MNFCKHLKFWRRRRAKREKIEDLEKQLEEERIKNYAEQQEMFQRWREAGYEVYKLEAEKEKAVQDLQDEKRRNAYEERSLLRTLLYTKHKLQVTEAKMEEATRDLEAERKRNCDAERIILHTLWYTKKKLKETEAAMEEQKADFMEKLGAERRENEEMRDIVLKLHDTQKEMEVKMAEMPKVTKDLEDQLIEERRKNLDEQRRLLESLCKIRLGVEEKLGQRSLTRSQQGEHNVARCGAGHEEGPSVNDFKFMKVLGRGAFGKILLAARKSPDRSQCQDKLYAIKVMKKRDIVLHGYFGNVKREKDILTSVNGCPFVISFYGFFQTEANLFFVMEFASGGDLKQSLNMLVKFNEKTATFYAAEIALALHFLHKKGIMHRDLKLDNVLVDEEGHIKICDFGLSKSGVFEKDWAVTLCGTLAYMAPEVVQQLPYRHEADWWSLGIILYEMLTGTQPFGRRSGCTLQRAIIQNDVYYPEWLSRNAVSILEGFLKKDPFQRLAHLEEIRSHPFFGSIVWQELENRKMLPPIMPLRPEEWRQLGVVALDTLITPSLPVSPEAQEKFNAI